MRKVFVKVLCALLLGSCHGEKKELPKDHPLVYQLVPNVHIASQPLTYSIKERLEEHEVAGISLGIIENNRLEFAKGYGFAVKDSVVPDNQTVFQVGSISKPIVSLVAMILAERGEIRLDSLATSYLKDWRFPKNDYNANQTITLRHLLNHTAGINMFNSKGMSPYKEMVSLKSIFDGEEYGKGVAIDTTAGARYVYSNYGYGILQKVLEDHTKKSLEQLAQELVFRPLGMRRSSFEKIVPKAELSGYAFAYDDEGERYPEYWNQPLIPGSGGLRSTVQDLSILLLAIQRAINGKQVGNISTRIAKTIISKKGYHLGFEIEGEEKMLSVTHTGRVKGFFAYMRIYPRTGNGIILLCNSDNGSEIFKDILRGTSDYFGWNSAKPRFITPIDVSKKQLEKYLGEYLLIYESDRYIAQILVEGNHLIFKMRDEAERYPLRMVGQDTFVDIKDGSDLDFISKDSVISQLILDKELVFEKMK